MLGVLFITFSGFVLVALATGAPPCSFHYPDYKTVDPDKGCKYYYECQNGKLTEVKCSVWSSFNPVSAKCEYLGVDCKAKPQAIPAPWPQPPCYSGGPDYLTKSPRGCKYYYRCKAGVVSEEQCESLKWFDPKTTQCRIMLIGCDEPSAPIPTPSTTKTTTTVPTTTQLNSATNVTTQSNSTTDVTTQPNTTTPVTTQLSNSTTDVTTQPSSTTHVTTHPSNSTTPVTTQNTSATTQSTSNNPTAPRSTTINPSSTMVSTKTTDLTSPTSTNTITPQNGTTQKSTTPNSASMLGTKTYFMTAITASLIILQNLFTTYDLSFLT